MRIDEKEDQIYQMCVQYGLKFSYAWGHYYVSVGDDLAEVLSFVSFSREELEGWGVDRIEEVVLGVVFESGVW